MTDEEAVIKIKRASIRLQRTNPFFACLSLFLTNRLRKVEDKKKWKDGGMGMAVDIEGNLYYTNDFVLSLTDEEMIGVLTHEIAHLVLMHLTRGQKLNRQIANISADVCVNEILKDNDFILPKGVIWSNDKREVEVFGKVVERCNTKTFEDVYWEIYEEAKNQIKQAIKSGKVKVSQGSGDGDGIEIDIDELGDYEIDGSSNDGSGKVRSFDRHIQGKGKDGKQLSEEERGEIERGWMERIHDSYAGAKSIGKTPVGLDRIIGNLHRSEINWKNLLMRYIQGFIANDYDYSRPSKKSISCGVYLPNVTKEQIEIYVCVDLSGSIGEGEMSDFLSEIVSLARAYREKIKFHLWTHETSVNDKYIVENGAVQKILSLRLHGGGGTSHKDCIAQLQKEKDCKVALFFTDGYSDLNEIDFKKNRFESIFILSKSGTDEQIKDKNIRIIKLKGELYKFRA